MGREGKGEREKRGQRIWTEKRGRGRRGKGGRGRREEEGWDEQKSIRGGMSRRGGMRRRGWKEGRWRR